MGLTLSRTMPSRRSSRRPRSRPARASAESRLSASLSWRWPSASTSWRAAAAGCARPRRAAAAMRSASALRLGGRHLGLGPAGGVDLVGEAPPLGDLALAGGEGLLLGRHRAGARPLGRLDRGRPLGRLRASSIAFSISAISERASRSMPIWRISPAVIRRASSRPRWVTMRARSTSSAAAISASSKACRWRSRGRRGALPGDAGLVDRAVLRHALGLGRHLRHDLGPAPLGLGPGHLLALPGGRHLPLQRDDLERLPARHLAGAVGRVALDARGLQRQLQRDVLALFLLAGRDLHLVERAARAISRRCVSRSVRCAPRRCRSWAMRCLSMASRAAGWPVRPPARAARARGRGRRAGRRGGTRSRAPAPAGRTRLSRSIPSDWCSASRFWSRIRSSVPCSMSLRILRRLSIASMSAVRPSASKAFEGLKNSISVWSMSRIATLSSSSPFLSSPSCGRWRSPAT